METQDTRPRATYLTGAGEEIRVILDHGEAPKFLIWFQRADGKLIPATLVRA